MSRADLAPLDLVRARAWRSATFTTYALSLSFVESVLLDALVRGGGRNLFILSDVDGVRAALSEQGARRAGRDYEVEPIKVDRGVFHAKVGVLAAEDDTHLLVGSGNLTFNGWGGNFEVLEHLHPSFAGEAFDDASRFFEGLAQATGRSSHEAGERLAATALVLTRAARGGGGVGDIRIIHSLEGAIAAQIVERAAELGGAERLVVAAPYWDGGGAVDGLAGDLGLSEVFVHAHHETAPAAGVANWPTSMSRAVRPVRIEAFQEDEPRKLHAKAFEIICRRGRLLISGSANASAAALGGPNNVEACVLRVQRERARGWELEATDPPAILGEVAEVIEPTERIGVLRATLRGDDLVGRVLTPTLRGAARALQAGSDGERDLGEVELDEAGRFTVVAPGLELQSLRGGRITLRIVGSQGEAEGFVSVAAYAEVSRRAGPLAPRLMALLAGSEAPADVAAIMSWLHEDPTRLRVAASSLAGGGGKRSEDENDELLVPVAELRPVFAVRMEGGSDATEGGPPQSGWARFMAQVFAALREPRGPVGRPERLAEDDEESMGGRATRLVDAPPDPDLERALRTFRDLFDLLLEPHNVAKHGWDAFDLAGYVCDRLDPSEALAASWVERLIEPLLDQAHDGRSEDLASAILLVAAHEGGAESILRARRRLLRLRWPLERSAPAANLSGFERIVGRVLSLADVWTAVGAQRTTLELVHSYLEALDGGAGADFAGLQAAAPDLWPGLSAALTSERARRDILRCPAPRLSCPRCSRTLPVGEAHRMRSLGLARAANCCGRILLCEGF